jgi:D-glycero-D-manno-heptose 1,7-bisphosphate phosphatase
MSGGALPIDDDGVWVEFAIRRRRPGPVRRPALFLDRDGVIVEDTGFLSREADVRLIAGASTVVGRANQLGVPVIVVSNQSGIGRCLFNWAAFARVQAHINDLLALEGARIDAVLACPHHPLAALPYTHPDAPWRKPNPGMLLKAGAHLDIELARSWIVGDRAHDLLAGRRAGLAGGVHVATGEGRAENERRLALALNNHCFRVEVARSIADVPDHVPLFAHEHR